MRFLLYETGNAKPSAPPSPELMAEMGKLIEETTRAGILLATGGLGDKSTHVRSSAGKVTITDGPFTETKELTGGFALIAGKSKEEGLQWAQRLPKIGGDRGVGNQEVFGGD